MADPVPLPDQARALWGGGDWTPRPWGGATGRIGYLDLQVSVWQSPASWRVEIWRWDRRRRGWVRLIDQRGTSLEAAIEAARLALEGA